MSRPSSPHTGDLDAVLRDDLALEQIGRGRRPRGSDPALKLLCAVAEDVEIRVPRRRTRGSRLTRGLLATTVAATVLGVTGVAAAEPGGAGNLAFWSPRPGDHIRAADRSLNEAQRSLQRGDKQTAAQQLDRADQELRRAGSSTHSSALQERAEDLRDNTETDTLRPLPTSNPTWSWLWGIPGGGPGWQPSKPPNERECLRVICRTKNTPQEHSVPQKTPGASSPSDSGGGVGLGSLFRKSSSTATPTTPGPSGPEPSSPTSHDTPSSEPSEPSESETVPPVVPTTPTTEPSPSTSSPSSSETESGSETETAEPRPSSTD